MENNIPTNYEGRIQELEAKYGWTFNFLKEAHLSPTEIVEYAYTKRTDYFKTWGIYFLFGVCILALSIISVHQNFIPDIMVLLSPLALIIIAQGASYFITIRKIFNDLLELAAEIDSNIV